MHFSRFGEMGFGKTGFGESGFGKSGLNPKSTKSASAVSGTKQIFKNVANNQHDVVMSD